MAKRFFDFILSLFGIILLFPFLIIPAILIPLGSKGGIFYRQTRVGRYNKDFKLIKFRTMKVESDKSGLLTTSSRDPRVTKIGYYLRKYKIDEFPQLINVLFGDMSLVGPRPEVRKYVKFYTEEQMKVLDYRPGITDVASIKYSNENEILEGKENPEKFYIEEIMQDKLKLNLAYLESQNLFSDIKTIFKTFMKIF
ncbi:sugar transferase [Eudoraea adriatica]|uniref:sugar transferase n=1 Tax=Eudoraea adriatica TaxID=446681 RepID=UPI00035C67C2|nr:sugar transferase [Eudoraea adriatica]